MQHSTIPKHLWLACIALGLAAGLGFLPWMSPYLVWDDFQYYNFFLSDPIKTALLPFNFNVNFWRPLATASFVLPWMLSGIFGGMGSAIIVSKVVGVAIFSTASAFACAACVGGLDHSRLSRAWTFCALFSLALLMATSPVFAEPVLWLSARSDLLVCMFSAIAMWAMFSKPGMKTGHVLLLGLALGFSKETGMIWCFALGILALRGDRLGSWSLGLLSAGAINLLAWKLALALAHPSAPAAVVPAASAASHALDPILPRSIGLLGFCSSFLESLGRNAYSAFAPGLDPCPIHPEGWGLFGSKAIGAVSLCVCAWLLLRHFSKPMDRSERVYSCFACACALILIISSAFTASVANPWFPFIDSIQKNRYLSAPFLIACSLAARWAIQAGPSRRAAAAIAALAIAIAAGSSQTLAERDHWSSGELALWKSCLASSPPISTAYTNYAVELYRQGSLGQAKGEISAYILNQPKEIPECSLWGLAQMQWPDDAPLMVDISKRRESFPTCPPMTELRAYPGLPLAKPTP